MLDSSLEPTMVASSTALARRNCMCTKNTCKQSCTNKAGKKKKSKTGHTKLLWTGNTIEIIWHCCGKKKKLWWTPLSMSISSLCTRNLNLNQLPLFNIHLLLKRWLSSSTNMTYEQMNYSVFIFCLRPTNKHVYLYWIQRSLLKRGEWKLSIKKKKRWAKAEPIDK